MKLLIATRNPDKIKEINQVFALTGLELIGARDIRHLAEIEEDGDTLEANAVKKAVLSARTSGLWALADDTGLEVDALDGRPGVHSARYAGSEATYADTLEKLLQEMDGQDDRRARFRTVIALSAPDGRYGTVNGICEGVITETARGTGGFGYDPVFLPDGMIQTFSEMDLAAKNMISHRGRALYRARDAWGGFLGVDADPL